MRWRLANQRANSLPKRDSCWKYMEETAAGPLKANNSLNWTAKVLDSSRAVTESGSNSISTPAQFTYNDPFPSEMHHG